MEEPNFQQTTEQAAAFQKIWMNSISQLMHASMAGANPTSPPPEITRQMREGILRALAGSWDEFMRSPQFLETVKDWMENAINFNRLTREMLGKAQNLDPAPSGEDIQSVLASVSNLEKRMLESFEKVGRDIAQINQALRTLNPKGKTSPRPVRRRKGEKKVLASVGPSRGAKRSRA